MKIVVTGKPGCGKSTLIKRVKDYLESKGVAVGGVFTPEIRVGNSRRGFKIVDIKSSREGVLASVDIKGPRVGRYGVNVDAIDSVAVPAIERALKEDDYIIIDEVAPMELKSPYFRRKVEEALSSDVPMVAAFHRSLIQSIKKYEDIKLFTVTPENREDVYQEIIDLIEE